jgi:hypothetical protein
MFDSYLHFTKISEVNKKVLESYWDRKNRFAIVKFAKDNFLVFLVSDNKKPRIPGYPATSVERFKSQDDAEKEIKKCYEKCGYTPENAEYGTWSS